MNKPTVGILMGSDSDLEVFAKAAKVLEEFDIPYEMSVLSAHRTPDRALEYAGGAVDRGLKIIIAGAGVAAHLAGVMAAHFPLPVIGVPVASGALNGVDALYSTVQMPPGIPVATVGVDNGKNAGLLAVQILATSDEAMLKKMLDYKKTMADGVNKKAKKLEEMGYKKYLEQK